jgi:ribosomal protein S18 acetylase RimI-like enzyme
MTASIIAPATRADLEPLAAMVNSAYRGSTARQGWTHESDLLDGQRTDAASLADELDAPDPSTILLLREEEDGPILACVMTQTFRDDAERLVCHLAMLTVRPGHQGQRLGRALIDEVEHRARAAGCAAVEMTVIHTRAELIAFYGRRGYLPTGRTKPFPYGDERFGRPLRDDLHFVVIEKVLAS